MPGEPRLRHNPLIDPRELERLHDQCFSWALTCTAGRRSEAEDVLQSTYLAVIEGAARFHGASSLRTWLFSVIRNQAHSRFRRMRRSLQLVVRLGRLEQHDEADAQQDTQGEYQRIQQTDRIRMAWQALPARQREVLDLVFYRDLPIAEAALIMSVSVGTARQHYERGKAALRARLAGLAEQS